MKVELKYGRNGLVVELPDHAQVVRSRYIPGFPSESEAIREALRNPVGSPPLRELIHTTGKITIVHTDITRATPNDRLLPVVLQEIEEAGAHPENVVLLNGLGTHRAQTKAELRRMLGGEIIDRYTCQQHDPYAADLVSLGRTAAGNPVRINRAYLESDIRILTGFIEPHLFAGFSGGPKAVLPALSGYESVSSNHSASKIAHPKATWGITDGNPIWEEMKEVALKTDPTFIVNVTLNANNQITGVFAGDLLAAHALGCQFARENAMTPVKHLYDIVITTNSGYPLDLNLYQSVKGMSAACKIVRPGGSIICVAACEEGVPEPSGYADLLKLGSSPKDLLDLIYTPGFHEPDQWQVQIQALIQEHADVYVYSDGLSDEQIAQSLFKPCRDIGTILRRLQGKYGIDASIAVLPEGPQTIPFLDLP